MKSRNEVGNILRAVILVLGISLLISIAVLWTLGKLEQYGIALIVVGVILNAAGILADLIFKRKRL